MQVRVREQPDRWKKALTSGLGVPALVFALSFMLLELAHPPHPLHEDTFEDLLLARACVEDALCPSAGVATSFGSIEQGALWVSLLAMLRAAGVSVATIHSLTFALGSLGVALIFAFLARRRGLEVASVTSALFLSPLLVGDTLHVLWNPSLMPLPAALLFTVSMRCADARKLVMAVPLGAALALTIEAHPVGVLAAPGALLVSGAFMTSRPAAAVAPLLSALVAGGLTAAISPTTAYRNASAALELVSLGGLVAASIALVATAVILSRRVEDLGSRARGVVASLALAAPVLIAVLAGYALGESPNLGLRYLMPALAPGVYLLAEGFASAVRNLRATRAFIVVASVSPLALTLWSRAEPSVETSLTALEPVQIAFEDEGRTLDEVWARLSGPMCGELSGGLAALGLPIVVPDGPFAAESMVVVMGARLESISASPADLSRGRWRTFETSAGEVLVGEIDTFVDRRHFRACVYTDETRDGAAPSCLDVDLERGIAAALGSEEQANELTWLDSPGVVVDREPRDALERRVTYRLPVTVPANAARRTISVPRRRMDCLRGRFIAAEGLRVVSSLPAEELVIEGTGALQRGSVFYEDDATRCPYVSLRVFPPCLSEVEDDDGPALRALLRPD